MRTPLSLAAILVTGAVLVGCGDDDADTSSADTTAATPEATASATPAATPAEAASGAITVRMTEFAFDPKDAVAKAGKVTISAPNDGKTVHELVILKTDADPAKLPMEGSAVDESTSVGEVPDVEAGDTKKVTLDLEAGKYAMVCALPGHYQSGMYGSLTVE